jgi:hypothetical protein
VDRRDILSCEREGTGCGWLEGSRRERGKSKYIDKQGWRELKHSRDFQGQT